MITLRKASDRGHAQHGWLNSWHSFSFADYYDPAHTQFSCLRVINDDRVDAGQGFATHGHRDMEILSYVLSGSLQHKDSMGNGKMMTYGEVQLMSAGTGVQHSEFNPSPVEAVHFLQIWIVPKQTGIKPGYQQKYFSPVEKQGRWCLLVSPDASDGSLLLHQDARVFSTILGEKGQLHYSLESGRQAYLHVAKGKLKVAGMSLEEGDALMFSEESGFNLEGIEDAELLLFDLP
ncbi:MAG: quercetin 2,3-dioxygenase [Gallionellales bacterium 35-53-114]|jgi:redox-sensitive bicupin YhaK (pirin superfamily)|nr:MAG: quercetin 2,3-dioxygenase [Gallionellales bacterium 35-53-114]OYZ63823.1 MAG: quercetin 2,3-dioxygenase [Gallionellales bacterium 24-53-125]OZB09345.1 MAG: quercetin 2,3-dioxygenase [Gallionellales bacterium 39-52-133]HQS57999.1 pirin family protein [Gallionellaceae bacterium]HQS76160.1 pirin family protein [Gallionellaceae bacterium]